jgi:amphi-Trp domain-containing protein
MGNKAEVRYKSTLDSSAAIACIENILACIKAGRLSVEAGDQSVILTPVDHTTLKVQAEQREDRESITIELIWRPPSPDTPDGDLKISS